MQFQRDDLRRSERAKDASGVFDRLGVRVFDADGDILDKIAFCHTIIRRL